MCTHHTTHSTLHHTQHFAPHHQPFHGPNGRPPACHGWLVISTMLLCGIRTHPYLTDCTRVIAQASGGRGSEARQQRPAGGSGCSGQHNAARRLATSYCCTAGMPCYMCCAAKLCQVVPSCAVLCCAKLCVTTCVVCPSLCWPHSRHFCCCLLLFLVGNHLRRRCCCCTYYSLSHNQVHEQQAGPQWVSNRRLQQLLEMGYGERDARLALAECSNNLQDAVEQLQQQRQGGAGTSSADADAEHATGSSRHASSTAEQEASGAGQSRRRDNDDRSQQGQLCALPPTADRSASHGRRSSSSSSDDAEEEVVAALGSARRTDPLAAYDIDVSEDGAAIVAYLARLGGGSSSGNGGGSSG